MKRTIYLFLLLLAAVSCGDVRRSGRNVTIKAENGEKIRVEVISDNIVRVSAVPQEAEFSRRSSLSVLKKSRKRCRIRLKKGADETVISTDSLNVSVNMATG